jgi:hypothetical protein
LTGTAQNASNLAGGNAGQLHYQVTTGVTGFVGTGTANQLLVSNGSSGPSFQNTSTIIVGYSANLTAGSSGQVPYQSAPGTTLFFGPGTAGQVLVSGGTSGPRYQNTLTLVGTTSSVSPTTGALVVGGGVGIGENLYVSGTIYGNLVGTATNIFSGTAGSIPIQSSTGTTSFIAPGTAGQILLSSGNTATFVNTSAVQVGFASNLTGGTGGAIPYQTAVNSTTFLSIGTNTYVLTSNGAGPTWSEPNGLTIGYALTATNLSGVFAGSVPYQSGSGVTAYTSGTTGQVLVSRGTGAPVFQSTLTLAGTTIATSTSTGALQVAGGVGIGGSIFVGGTGTILSTVASTTTLAANALYVAGGVGISSSLLVTGPAFFRNDVTFSGTTTYVFSTETVYTDSILELHYSNPSGVWTVNDEKDIGLRLHYFNGSDNNAFLGRSNQTGYLEWYGSAVESNTSTITGTYGTFKTGGLLLTSGEENQANTTTGALQVAGGASIGGNLYVKGTLVAEVITGVITTATGFANGSAGEIPIQVRPGQTSFISSGTAGQLLQAGNSTATFVSTATLLVGNSVNLAGGTAGTIAYQTAAGSTGFVTTASNGQVLVSGGTGTPVYQNTLTLAGTTSATSTITGALQVAGGAGIGGDLYVGGNIFGIITTASNLAVGTTGSIPIQSGTGTTAFIPLGTSGSLLVAATNTATWISTSTIVIGFSSTATNLLGGTTGVVPYQIRAGITGFIGTGTTGSLLQMGATTATFVNTLSIMVGFAGTASNIAGGATGSIVYQSNTGTSTFLSIGTSTYVLTSNGTIPTWTAPDGLTIGYSLTATNILGGSTGSIPYQTRSGATDFIGTGTSGSLLQMGSNTATFISTTSIAVGYAANILGGTAAALVYQTAANTTGFVTTASNGQVLVSGGIGAPIYQNTLTLAGTTAATSTSTGALQVRGGVGIGGNLYVGGSLNVPTITGTISTATNIAGGTAGQLHYQSAPGTTAFVTVGTAGQVLVSGGTGAPVYQNTLTLVGTTAATSTASGAFQVVGGVGIGGALYVGGTVTAPTFVGTLTGTATTATNLAAGATGSIPIQSASGATAFIPLGTSGFVLTAGATTATWQPVSGITAGRATTATNLDEGLRGQIPYQSAPGVTRFINTGVNGSLLQIGAAGTATFVSNQFITVENSRSLLYSGGVQGAIPYSGLGAGATSLWLPLGTTGYVLVADGSGDGQPAWAAPSSLVIGSATTATNIAGGLPGQLVYQVAPGSTGFVTTATSGFVLTSRGTGSPIYQNTLTLSGSTPATSTATGALTVVGGVGIGGDLYIGGTIFGLASVSGTVSTATNLSGNTAGSIPYQSAAGVTSYVSGTVGQVLVSRGGSAPVFQSTMTLSGTSGASSTVTGALQVAGGVGIGGSVFVGGTVTATTFVGALTGTATTATNIAGGTTGVIPYQLSPGATGFIGTGTTGSVLRMGATTASFVSTTTLQVGYSVHLLGGAAGSLPYQSGPNATTFLSISGSNGFVLTSNGTGPQWTSLSGLGAGTATTTTNIAGGLPGQLVYQVAPSSTGFVSTATAGYVLTSGGTGSPVYQNTLTLSATTVSASTTTGALQVAGGVGIGGALWAGQDSYFNGVLIGRGAGANVSNIAIGQNSMSFNFGIYNLAIGNNSQYGNGSGSSSYNTSVGYYSLNQITTGAYNAILGYNAGYGITTAQYSVGIGYQALEGNTTVTGDYNTAVGGRSIRLITSGTRNTGVGYESLYQVSGQSYNTAVGAYSQGNNFGGSYNTSLGDNSLYAVTTGSYNIAIGYQAGNSINSGTNNTIIGSVSGTAGMTGTVIVAAGTAERFRINSVGNMGIGTTTPSALLDVNGTVGVRSATNATSSSTGALQVTGGAGIGSDLWVGGTAYATVLQSTSDINFKKDITTITNALNTVLQMRGVEYKWTHNSEPGLGLIAQEVQPLVPAAVSETGDRLTVGYGNLVGLLVEAIKEQQQQILTLQQEIRDLKR